MFYKFIKLSKELEINGFYKDSDVLNTIIIKLAGINDEGGLEDPTPFSDQKSPVEDYVKDKQLPIYNNVANDLSKFFNSYGQLERFRTYRRNPELEAEETNPNILKALQATNDLLDEILVDSLEHTEVISSIAKTNNIDQNIIYDAIVHMIGNYNPLNPTQVQIALHEVSFDKSTSSII